jgi:hypothetical protein
MCWLLVGCWLTAAAMIFMWKWLLERGRSKVWAGVEQGVMVHTYIILIHRGKGKVEKYVNDSRYFSMVPLVLADSIHMTYHTNFWYLIESLYVHLWALFHIPPHITAEHLSTHLCLSLSTTNAALCHSWLYMGHPPAAHKALHAAFACVLSNGCYKGRWHSVHTLQCLRDQFALAKIYNYSIWRRRSKPPSRRYDIAKTFGKEGLWGPMICKRILVTMWMRPHTSIEGNTTSVIYHSLCWISI